MPPSPRLTLLALALGLALSPASTPARAGDVIAPDDPAGGAIRVYQRHLSAMRHLRCRFAPSCSQYAADAIAAFGVVEGSARAADRLMRCNLSADSRHPRNSDGLLVDPADGSAGDVVAVRVPHWLLLPGEGPAAPVAAGLAPDRRARLDESLQFALLLERRGDCERASAELQRAGMLADTLAAHAWAYARIAGCYFGASQWYFADRAYLTSAMLASDDARRANVGYAAAASRFNAGAFAACARLLADSALATPAAGGFGAVAAAGPPARAGEAEAAVPGVRVVALAGLCAFAVGDWAGAGQALELAASESRDAGLGERVARLAAFAREGPALPRRSPGVAGSLSTLVPGSGQAYCGQVRTGVRHLLFNAALVYTVASLAGNDQAPAAVLAGSVALPFYLGNVLGARDAARRFNRERRMRLLERALEASER